MEPEASLSPADTCGGGAPRGSPGEGTSGKRGSLTGFYSHFFSSFQGAVSQAEASFTREGAACGVRVDGRGPTDLRPRALVCGLLPLSCGSAAIQTEENAVIVTIDSDLMLLGSAAKQEAYTLTVGWHPPFYTGASHTCVWVSVQLLTQMHAQMQMCESVRVGRAHVALDECFLPALCPLALFVCQNMHLSLPVEANSLVVPRRRAAEEELADVTGGDGATLSSLVHTMLEQLLLPHLKPLKEEGANNASWRLSIDVIVLKAGGCLLDAVSLAIWAAFRDLRLPNVLVEEGEEKDQGLAAADLRVSCDERISAGRPYPVETVPIFLTAAQIGGSYIWDLTDVEAACADSFLVAVLMPSGACVGLQKFGHVLCDCRTLQTTLATSQRLSREIFGDLHRQCESSSNSGPTNLDSFFALASL
ncbi:hypothetical protein Esti_006198 [Eimeria stiedai]